LIHHYEKGWSLKRLIVGLTGSAGAGKSSAAAYLNGQGFQVIKFAGGLKKMAAAIGLSPRHIEGDLKEVPCDLLCGKTPRFLMQRLGTELGRDMIGKDFWVNIWKNEVNSLPEGTPVVTDDCRFPNEEEALRSLGGKIIRIQRQIDTTTATFNHESEQHIIKADFVVLNDGSFSDLHSALDQIFKLAA
jgi:hypothetical protein